MSQAGPTPAPPSVAREAAGAAAGGPDKAAPAAAAGGADPGDEALVARAKAGERAAFDALVRRYQERIYGLCWQKLRDAEEAADATQETFLKAYRGIGAFEGKSQFFTWLFRIALNCTFTRRKKRARERELTPVSRDQAPRGGDGEDGPSHADAPDLRDEPAALALRGEQARRLSEAIAALPKDHHRIVVLRDVEGLAYEEIAAVLEIPVGSVKSRLHRARLTLRDMLKGYVSTGDEDEDENDDGAMR